MKKIFSILLSILLITFGFKSEAQQVMSRADKNNILYVDVDNPMTIMTYNIPIKDIQLEMANCSIKKIDDYHFIIHPKTSNYEGARLVFKHNGKIIGEEVYRIKSIPPPTARVGRVSGVGEMSVGELKAQAGISAVLENFDFDVVYRVLEYRIQVIRAGKIIADHTFDDGPIFNASCKSIINEIQPGDEVMFSEMKFKMKNSELLRSTENSIISIKIK